MKQIILIFTALAFIGLSAQSQDNRSKFKFGIKLGSNYSNVYDTEGEEFNADARFGFVTGAFMCIPIGEMMGVQPEILFSQKGFKATGSLLGSTYHFTRTTSYIDVPIFFTLKPASFLTIMAGPQYSYLLQQKDLFESGTTTIAQETEFMNDDIRKNIFGFVLGGDVNLDHFVVGGRFGFDLFKNNSDGSSTTPRYKNVWFQATLGYKFYSE